MSKIEPGREAMAKGQDLGSGEFFGSWPRLGSRLLASLLQKLLQRPGISQICEFSGSTPLRPSGFGGQAPFRASVGNRVGIRVS